MENYSQIQSLFLGEGVISVHNSENNLDGEFEEICGYAEQLNPEGEPGELYVTFPQCNQRNNIDTEEVLISFLLISCSWSLLGP